MNEKETVKSIILTVKGETYELDYNRESAVWAENHGITLARLTEGVPTSETVRELFWTAFRMHHKRVSRQQADDILETMGGMSMKMFTRLTDLFTQAAYTGVITEEDGEDGKNPEVTVEM